MTVKPNEDTEELITAADYDKVMKYVQGTPGTNNLKILERITLFSLEIIKLHKEERDKQHLEKEKKPMDAAAAPPLRKVCLLPDAVPTKKRSPRPCKVDDDPHNQYYREPSSKKLKAKGYHHHPESSNEKTVTSDLHENPDPTNVVVEEEEENIQEEEWHPESSTLKKDKRKKNAVSRGRNPNPRNPNPRNPNPVNPDPRSPNPVNPNPTNGPPASREIPVFLSEMMERMKGSEIVLVIEKALTNSDMNRNLSRLQMPESQMNKFLREEEIEYLKIKVGHKMNGIEALLHQRGGELSSKVKLRRWNLVKEKNSGCIVFVLGTGWNHVVARNKLRSGDTVQVWSFRVDNDLHFALVVL